MFAALKQFFSQTTVQLFLLIFIHNTCLDVAIITSKGFIFYTEKSLHLTTVATHVWVAAVVAVTYVLIKKWQQKNASENPETELPLVILSLICLLGFGGLHIAW